MGKIIKFSTLDTPYTGSGDKTVNFQGTGVYFNVDSTSSVYINNQPITTVVIPTSSSYSNTSSYSLSSSSSLSSSYSLTSSYALNGGGGGSGNFNVVISTGSGVNSTVRVSASNTSTGNYSSVVGGSSNTASGTYAFIGGGYSAIADKYGQNSHASGRFSVDGDAQTSVLIVRNTTSGSSTTELFLDGSSAQIVIGTDCIWGFTAKIVCAKRDGAAGFWQLKGCIKNISGTVSIIGNIEKTIFAKDSAVDDCDVSAIADDTNNALSIKATGSVGHIIRWVARIEIVEIIRDSTGSGT